MRTDQNGTRSAVAWLASLALATIMTGCSTVKLVGDYDEQLDKGTTALQKEVEAHLVKLESTAPKQSDKVETYDKHKQFYADAKVTVSGLRIRADATERNSLTVRMFDKLRNNLGELEEMHNSSEGLTKAEITKSIRGGFNTQFTAILTFELAKKRGEKPDESKASSASTPAANTKGESK